MGEFYRFGENHLKDIAEMHSYCSKCHALYKFLKPSGNCPRCQAPLLEMTHEQRVVKLERFLANWRRSKESMYYQDVKNTLEYITTASQHVCLYCGVISYSSENPPVCPLCATHNSEYPFYKYRKKYVERDDIADLTTKDYQEIADQYIVFDIEPPIDYDLYQQLIMKYPHAKTLIDADRKWNLKPHFLIIPKKTEAIE